MAEISSCYFGLWEAANRVLFITQIVGNACATIVLLYAVANMTSKISPSEESFLDRFLKTTASMNPFERGVFLKMTEK
ncbi:hypothetical protein SLA2020_037950 [Shorea laevis]